MDRLMLNVDCFISLKGAADADLSKIMHQYHADAVDPLAFGCRDCGLDWENQSTSDWLKTTCSNCYSENVYLIKAQLEFANWGRQNGGAREMKSRYDAAREEVHRTQAEGISQQDGEGKEAAKNG